jgi:hypothetical protein
MQAITLDNPGIVDFLDIQALLKVILKLFDMTMMKRLH